MFNRQSSTMNPQGFSAELNMNPKVFRLNHMTWGFKWSGKEKGRWEGEERGVVRKLEKKLSVPELGEQFDIPLAFAHDRLHLLGCHLQHLASFHISFFPQSSNFPYLIQITSFNRSYRHLQFTTTTPNRTKNLPTYNNQKKKQKNKAQIADSNTEQTKAQLSSLGFAHYRKTQKLFTAATIT